MTDEQIIKALETYLSNEGGCSECAYLENIGSCVGIMHKDLYDLINRQKAEIERLEQIQSDNEKAFNRMTELYNKAFNRCKTAKAEAIKEFADKLKEKAFADKYYEHESIVYLADIDNLVKEMAGDTE